LDTAISYGDSEKRLGEIGVNDWQIVTKLPAVPQGCKNISSWVTDVVNKSVKRLKVENLYALLLHRPDQLLQANGMLLFQSLEQLKRDGLVNKIGISIYDPEELEEVGERYQFDIVQAPFNIFDRRLVDTGWVNRLKNENIELHVRSIFLQGLLLMNSTDRPDKFTRWSSLWTKYDKWLEQNNVTSLQACLRYALSVLEINKVIVGVDSLKQLQDILAAAMGTALRVPNSIASNDTNLINPTNWGTHS
jgi:aryl-alcohol dehydrogenase-like predicted oxidoreductase